MTKIYFTSDILQIKFKFLLCFVIFLSGYAICAQTTKKDLNKAKDYEQNISHKNLNKLENQEQNISYKDIITKINDINIKNKDNKRIKEIIKDYTYNVGDDDSKNSAKEKALNQAKVIILEEIGVFVESYLDIKEIVDGKKYHKQFKQEIRNLAAGIIKIKILEQKYDNKTYYIKASALVDPDSISEGISEVLKIKANKGEIKKLNALLKSKEKEIDIRSQKTIKLQKKIAAQELINIAKQKELKDIQSQLKLAKSKLQEYEVKQKQIKSDLRKILNRLNTQTRNIEKFVKRGMTKAEVKKIMGEPTYSSPCYAFSCTYIYGTKEIEFSEGIVERIRDL